MSEPHWLCIPLGLGLQREGDVVSKLLSGLETLGSAHTFFFFFVYFGSVHPTGLTLRDLPVSASQVPGLKVCTTLPNSSRS